MIRDKFLEFGVNARPPGSGILAAGVSTPVPFPDGYVVQGGNPAYLDLFTNRDIGNGRALTAEFRIKTSFTGAALNTAAFSIIVADSPDMITGPITLVRSGPISTAGLVAETRVVIVVPPLSSIARVGALGKRYLFLAMEITSPAATDFTGGAVDAHIYLDAATDLPSNYPSGYSV